MVCGDQCVDVSTVRRWVRRFKDGELGQAALKTKHQFFKGGVQKIVHLCRQGIEVRGDFVEK